RYFFYEYTRAELQEWFFGLVEEYRKWTDFQFAWQKERTGSIKELQFPFDYREGQRELITYVYRTILNRKKLFLEAPTGVGKTISTVFPTVKAMGEGHVEKLFYLTAKTITRTVAEESFQLLRAHGLKFKTVVLTAKEKICFQEVMECNPDACPYARGHFDRINDAIYDLLTHEDSFTREAVEVYAKKHEVCPFEMSLDMSLFSDGVIGDYNYVFDPHVYLRRFFAEGVRRDYQFLVDEAHNLLERGRSMYSAVLRKEDLMTLRKTVLEHEPKIARALSKSNKEFLALKKECTGCNVLSSIDALVVTLTRLSSTIETFLEDKKESVVHDDVLEFFFELSHFLLIYDKLDEHYVIYSELESDGSFIVKLFCVDPASNLQECMGRGRSTILFSATLLPIQYYKGLLGGLEDDYEVYADSVFDPGKRLLLIASDVTSKYTRRGQEEYLRIASYIKEITRARDGNYMVFFPSHAFLQEVRDVYETYFLDETDEILCQEEYMKEEDREAFLARFAQSGRGAADAEAPEPLIGDADTPERAAHLIGFCVLGGIFSEGIDLKGEQLIGAIIVGTGLPQVCNERELMSSFFKEEDRDGFRYAYQYPGMNKVAQAAGRVIRTVEDTGIVALLDERFLQNSYVRMFPKEWTNYHKVTIAGVKNVIDDFWNTQPK
nr:ATP-dependent DNA helicase [Lachnospiraceae bacterium]